MNDADFRTLLQDRLGPALDELSAPDLLSGVRARQVRHHRSVRAGLAAASTATVAAVVVAVAVWPHTDTAGPAAPAAPSLSVTAVPSAAVPSTAAVTTPTSAVPSPSTAIVQLTGLAPLVTSGPCAGLTVGAFVESRDIHPVITPITSAGASLTTSDGHLVDLRAQGPCLDRLSFVQHTPTFQNANYVPYSFVDGEGVLVTQGAAKNETGVVQLFLDCKGLVCSGSGAPLATLIVKVRGTGPGAAAQPFPPAPTPLPTPSGSALTVPSVIGLSMDDAERALVAAGLGIAAGTSDGLGTDVVAEDPRVGSVVPAGTAIYVQLSGPTRVAMPSVVGLTLTQAEALLAKAGISYQVVHALRSAPLHTVTYQDPKAGVTVTSSTVVQLTEAIGPVKSPTAP